MIIYAFMIQKGQKIARKLGKKCLLYPLCKIRFNDKKYPNRLYCSPTHKRYGKIIRKRLNWGINKEKMLEKDLKETIKDIGYDLKEKTNF